MIGARQSVLPEGTRRPSNDAVICLLSVHGIGINQARSGKRRGYADQLHEHLRSRLPSLLSRNPDQPDNDWPVYVVGKPNDLGGLDRLTNPTPLVTPGARIAHVALVYTPLDVTGFDSGSFVRGGSRILFHIFAYATPAGLIREAVADFVALISHRGRDPSNPYPSLRVARDTMKRGITGMLPLRGFDQQHDPASGLLVLVKQIVDDFLSYLCRARVRDEIVDFVQKALVRIADRGDIGAIVLNTHSQGTVATFDALTDLDDDQPEKSVQNVRSKVVWLITAGSPLRKVVQVFGWQPLLRNFDAGWTNFWDQRDPAADPLKPPRSWRLGMKSSSKAGTLFRLSGLNRLTILDRRLSNIDHSSGGGLQAHNYWDNEPEFITPVSEALVELTSGI